ncbi:MAG: Ig-like domain-containing protein [Gemmatimonadota bacterium]|nr:Ig-like domain-containing protein [Gemmatimonadota bacterium]
MLLYTAILALVQQTAPPQTARGTIGQSPVARIVVTPTTRTVAMGDTVRIRAQAVDAAGNPVANARILFAAQGSAASIDSAGMLVGAAVGRFPLVVTAVVPRARPVIERIEMQVVPGPAARIVVAPRVTRLVVGQRMRVGATAYAASGDQRTDRIVWRSSAPGVVRVDDEGLVRAIAAGRATLSAMAGSASESVSVQVLATPIASIEITPSRPVMRSGDVIRFAVTPKDRAGRAIEGLTPTWSFSPGKGVIDDEGAFVGYEPGTYVVTATLGARSVDVVVRLEPREVRRPVRVVGRLPRLAFPTSEVWIHPNGTVAYLGTHGGGDRVYTIDISNPADPVVVDSIQANTRLVNDMMTTPDGKFMVFTRENASDRKNGIVIASLEDPLRPKAIAEFTEGVTSGVHSAFIYKDPRYGTHIYLTNDGTGAMHVINIDDPYKPAQVAELLPPGPTAGNYIHDIDVQDGLLYGSWWDDGLVIVDVGNGIKGGSPSKPVIVSQYKYNLDEMYRDVEAVSGPGFTRGTHTAWRHKDYVFIADEVYRNGAVAGAEDAAASRMYGKLQVLDVSDIENPHPVAWYEPEHGGVHNLWVAGDTLYMGAYDAGFRAFDISGELRGDLRAQGREIAHLHTGDMNGFVANAPMTWGVVVNKKDGLAYVNDFNNGLWVVRIEPRAVVP